MSDILTERFTLVFEGNLRDFKGNPFKTDTPFGIPIIVGLGDAFEECEKLREELSAAVSNGEG
ncbi:hypothetical protein JQ600_35400 [Bradyrhizobium sp. AUGA SZCCT0176]|uniref:hypothetical protein n=1 Tax=Bradyrhizobium sp. AUGA SZCCT0176 TaxID=2807664 RepID=UPI001BA97AB3|nr:hypothetical protein [Bradyrhizobium sp. AUGA SZCCT0176]MBR1230183.1 hypothetical protein [Bradyrhizobium sp. AUGA SZCCT0176]